jgi:hypothetical protein
MGRQYTIVELNETSDDDMLKVRDWRGECVVGAVDAATDSDDDEGLMTGLDIELTDRVRLFKRVLGEIGGGWCSTIPSVNEEG